VEGEFLEALAKGKSNIPEHRDGAQIYRKFASPAAVNLEKLAAHYAISSLFKPYTDQARIYCYSVQRQDHHSLGAGQMRLGLGRARFTSEITRESAELVFAALHFGDHNLSCGIRAFQDEEAYQKLVQDMTAAFSTADIPEALRVMDKELGSAYSLKSLFRDDRRAILKQVLSASLEEAETAYRQIYEHHVPLAHFLRDLGTPLPKAIRTAAEFALNSHLRQAFASEEMDLEQVRKLLDEARAGGIALDSTMLEYTLRLTIERLVERLAGELHDLSLIERLEAMVDMARSLPFEVVLWTAQNVWSELCRANVDALSHSESNEEARSWARHFRSLGDKLQVRYTCDEVRVLTHAGN
jgi:hypothetical protein